jgi:hypothetical protein
MIGFHFIALVDGPLVANKTRRTAMIERMASDLVRAGTANSEVAAMRTLKDCGHAMTDIVMLVDDARQAAMQEVVAGEARKP